MKIYISASWKNQHAVEMLTHLLRKENKDYEILSFVENSKNEGVGEGIDNFNFEKWMDTDQAERCFRYDTDGATESDLVIYISPSGTDAWAEVGAAWASGIPILGLYAKGEQSGIMRKMVSAWYSNYDQLIKDVNNIYYHG